ncbi:hypothetical protein SAMN04488569_100354, partial [Marinilactibacillus piezotolerans]
YLETEWRSLSELIDMLLLSGKVHLTV